MAAAFPAPTIDNTDSRIVQAVPERQRDFFHSYVRLWTSGQ
jgi:hypothetical protein